MQQISPGSVTTISFGIPYKRYFYGPPDKDRFVFLVGKNRRWHGWKNHDSEI
jgi:hypothetical protein